MHFIEIGRQCFEGKENENSNFKFKKRLKIDEIHFMAKLFF